MHGCWAEKLRAWLSRPPRKLGAHSICNTAKHELACLCLQKSGQHNSLQKSELAHVSTSHLQIGRQELACQAGNHRKGTPLVRLRALLFGGWRCGFFSFTFFLLFFFFGFFRSAPLASGSSQARGQIRAAAVILHHSHSNLGSEPHLRPTLQLRETPDPSILSSIPLSKA